MWDHSLENKKSVGGVALAICMLAMVSVAPAGFVCADDSGAPAESVVEEQNITSEPETSTETVIEENTNEDNVEGADGAAGTDGGSGDATVITGDATSGVSVENTINTNTVDTVSEESVSGDPVAEESATETETAYQTASSTSEEILGTENTNELHVVADDESLTATTTLSVENTNVATSTTSAISTAATGNNEASTGLGTALIDSGNSYAFANVLNLVNSNFTGADGNFQLLNLFGSIFGDLSLNMEDGAECSFLCLLTRLYVANYNNAFLENNIAVLASTGSNMATSTNGDAGITTGDAFAAANVINVVNTNIVSSDYLAFIMNAFGSWEGDLVLPPGSFWDDNSVCCGGGDIIAENRNEADIENNVDAGADSGSNEAVGDGSAIVETGAAGSTSNVMTIANTNIFGNNFLLIYVRTQGAWQGSIFSLPNGVNIIPMGDGFIVDGFSAFLNSGSLPVGVGSGIASTSVFNENMAHIVNNVSANASTGGNAATAGGEASIETGNAYAAANVVNIANTNIVGRNWLLAVVNIFGGWAGNVAFGRPDLWVGASAEGPSPLQNGQQAEFTLTYRNNGNAPATQSKVSFNFGSNLNVVDTRGGVVEGETITFDAGTINPGAFGSFSFVAQTQNAPTGNSQAVVFASAGMYEKDGNTSNNVDELRLDFYNQPPPGFLGYSQIYARLEIVKERKGADTVPAGSPVDYVITIENKGAGSGYNVLVKDEIKNAKGSVISNQNWNLETMYPGEKVVIEYTVEFAQNTPPGAYTNYALAKWYDESGNYVDHSGHASAEVEIEAYEEDVSSGGGDTAFSISSGYIDGIGGFLDDDTAASSAGGGTSTTVAIPAGTVSGGQEFDDILEDVNPVYITDARPLDANLRGEIAKSLRNPWDPRNLFASIALSSVGYSILWALLAAVVVYIVTRRRSEA